MTTQLRTPITRKILGYVVIEGPVPMTMPYLAENGLIPVNLADLIDLRLEVLGRPEEDSARRELWTCHFISGDSTLTKGEDLYIFYDDPRLRSINSSSRLDNSTLDLTGEALELEKSVFSLRRLVNEGLRMALTPQPVIYNTLCDVLARTHENPGRFQQYMEAVESEAKNLPGSYKAMNILLPYPSDKPRLYMWCLGGVNGGSFSEFNGRTIMGNNHCRILAKKA